VGVGVGLAVVGDIVGEAVAGITSITPFIDE
jgi:hypothetical protein